MPALLTPATLYQAVVANRPHPDNPAASFQTAEADRDILYKTATPPSEDQILQHLATAAHRYRYVTFTSSSPEFADCLKMNLALGTLIQRMPYQQRLPCQGAGPLFIVRLYLYQEVNQAEELDATTFPPFPSHFGITTELTRH